MQQLFRAGVMAMALGLPAAVQAADPVEGLWRTAPGDTGGHLEVEIAPCGGGFCGTIRRAVDKAGREVADYDHLGRQMIFEMRADGGGAYSGGKIWAPDRDKTYNARMRLGEAGLSVSGCVLGICRDGGTWTRAD